MNCKKAGLAFLMLVVINYVVIALLCARAILVPGAGDIPIVPNLLISEGIVVVPVLLVTLLAKKGEPLNQILGFHRIKISTALMIILFTVLVMPLATLLNAVSMLFVDNQVAGLSGDIVNVPFLLMFFLMAIFGPFCEEVVFRGVIYHSYRHSRNLVLAVIWSAVLFGLMHMNFNQMPYAIALGIMMALLVEATGSTTSSFLLHMIFNGESVCMIFLEDRFFPEEFQQELANGGYTSQQLYAVISVMLIVATVCTALAFCLLNRIAENEGRHHFLQVVWGTRHNHAERIVTVPLIVAVILSLVYMIANAIMGI